MATTTPFAFNTGSTIAGTSQVGQIAVGTSPQEYSLDLGGVKWWMGPDEELGYVVTVPVSGNTQPTPIIGVDASIGFYRSDLLTDNSFVNLTNIVFSQSFTSATDASIWLTNNGYWTSYPAPVLYLDAGNLSSYPGSGNTWTDIVSGRTFNLINGPTYNSGNGGKINFTAASSQYAQCNSSLPNLNTWSVGVWHYYTNTNVGNGMCLVTEVYPGSTTNINFSLGDNLDVTPLSSGFFNGAWRTSGTYSLTPNTWYYIVGTYDGYTNKLYVNNTLVASSAYVGTPISSQGGIRLMSRWDNASYWGGSLGVVGIYDKPLTSGQISTIWETQKERFGYLPSLIMNLDSTTGVTGSNWTDISGGGHNATLNGGYGTTTYNGNQVVTLNGTNGYVLPSSFGSQLSTGFTYNVWVYPTTTSNGTVIGEWGGVPPNGWTDAQIAFVSGNINAGVYPPGNFSPSPYITGPSFVANTWYNLALTYNPSTGDLKFYVNGTLSSTTNGVKANPGNLYLTLGRTDGSGTYLGGATGYFQGYVGSWKIWNGPLSSASILNNFNTTKSIYGL